MNSTIQTKFHPYDADKIGVIASLLCAFHCCLAPILLLFLPKFGSIWAHPASHTIVAAFIVPLAIYSIYRGYKKHSKHWVIVSATVGIMLVLVGAALPTFRKPAEFAEIVDAASKNMIHTELTTKLSSTSCGDQCCPSFVTTETGQTSLNIPSSATLTTLGGIFLIIAHIGNLCFSRKSCQSNSCKSCFT